MVVAVVVVVVVVAVVVVVVAVVVVVVVVEVVVVVVVVAVVVVVVAVAVAVVVVREVGVRVWQQHVSSVKSDNWTWWVSPMCGEPLHELTVAICCRQEQPDFA